MRLIAKTEYLKINWIFQWENIAYFLVIGCLSSKYKKNKKNGQNKVLKSHPQTCRHFRQKKKGLLYLWMLSCCVVTNKRSLLNQAVPSGQQLNTDYNWQHPVAEWTWKTSSDNYIGEHYTDTNRSANMKREVFTGQEAWHWSIWQISHLNQS